METATSYMGMRLAHPFIAGASPMGADIDVARRLEDAGCAALVMPSLFEEEITRSQSGTIHHKDPLDRAFSVDLAPYPAPSDYALSPIAYLEHIRRLKTALDIPVIASLNGTTSERWLTYARLIEEAGADALEVNMYEVVTDLGIPSIAVETQIRDLVVELKRTLRIPLAMKLSPFFSAFGNFARQLDRAGADALVLFNRFYQPDVDTRHMAAVPVLELSHNDELRLRLRWMAILHGRIRPSLALTGGVETATDGIKGILAGAHVIQVVSAALRHGPAYFATLREGLTRWMEWQQIGALDHMRGRIALEAVGDPAAFERASYIRALNSWGK
jgi:dihydroorotate dehydrogenase (fumarate)